MNVVSHVNSKDRGLRGKTTQCIENGKGRSALVGVFFQSVLFFAPPDILTICNHAGLIVAIVRPAFGFVERFARGANAAPDRQWTG